MITEFIDMAYDALYAGAERQILSLKRELDKEIRGYGRKAAKAVLAFMLFSAAGIFIILSFHSFLIDILLLSGFAADLLTGFVLLLAGFIIMEVR